MSSEPVTEPRKFASNLVPSPNMREIEESTDVPEAGRSAVPQLSREPCVSYDIQLRKCSRKIVALLDCGSEVNAMSRGLAAALKLRVMHTKWGAASIDGSQLMTYGMVSAVFSVDDKLGQMRWFEETFFLADLT